MKKRKIKVGVLLLAAICSIAGVRTFIKAGEPIVLETVSDTGAMTAAMDEKENNKNAGLDLKVKSAVLIDADTGKVLFTKNPHKELPPASVTKIMTMLLTMEAVRDGKIKMSDKVTISEKAASMGGSQMFMEEGESHKLEELLEGIAIVSANDACVATAEYVAGSEEVFVEKMNSRAKALSMSDTNFVNTNGLPAKDHYTSAYDIALMSRELLKFDEPKKWFNTWQKTIKVGLPGKEKEFGLTNTNKLIKHYPGANGIKTGFTEDAGFCLSASATREGTTLIAVVLGAETSKSRNAEVAKLLNYGFANYKSITVCEKGEKVKKIDLIKGEPRTIYAQTKTKITAFVKKGGEEKVSKKAKVNEKTKLPLKKGEKVGTLTVYVNGKKAGEYPLVSSEKVKKVSFVTYCIRSVKNIFKHKEG